MAVLVDLPDIAEDLALCLSLLGLLAEPGVSLRELLHEVLCGARCVKSRREGRLAVDIVEIKHES